MSKIKEYFFADLYDISSGISSKPEQAGHGTPFVSFSTVFNNYFLPEKLPDLMDTSAKEQETYSVKSGDIFLTRTSETIDELAMSCVAIHDYPKTTFSGFVKRLRPKNGTEKIVYSKYLAFYLRGYIFRQTITNHSIMTLRASFNEHIFKLLKIYLPDFKQQKLIGDLLYTIEQKISLNNRINAELEKTARVVYEYMFLRGKPQNTHFLSKKLSFQRGVEPGRIAYSETKTEINNIPFIRVRDLGQSPALFISKENAKNTYCKPNDVLVAFDGSVGKMSIAMEGAYSTGIRKIKAKDSDYSDALIYFIFSSEEIQETIKKYAVGSNILHSASSIEHLTFPWQKEKVEIFNEKVEPMYQMIVKNILENKALTEQRDFLLPLLMNGQVTVKGGEE